MNCPVCLEQFSDQVNIPFIIKTCGHTFCKLCLDILEDKGLCPICKTNYTNEDIIRNYIVLDLIPHIKSSTITILEKCSNNLQMDINIKANECMRLQNKFLTLQEEYVELTKDYNSVFNKEYERVMKTLEEIKQTELKKREYQTNQWKLKLKERELLIEKKAQQLDEREKATAYRDKKIKKHFNKLQNKIETREKTIKEDMKVKMDMSEKMYNLYLELHQAKEQIKKLTMVGKNSNKPKHKKSFWNLFK